MNDFYVKNPWQKHLRYAQNRCRYPDKIGFKYYKGKGIQCLLTPTDVRHLWDRDAANKLSKPSLDRINSDGHYELSNCRFIELSKNQSISSTETSKRLAKCHIYHPGKARIIHTKKSGERRCKECARFWKRKPRIYTVEQRKKRAEHCRLWRITKARTAAQEVPNEGA